MKLRCLIKYQSLQHNCDYLCLAASLLHATPALQFLGWFYRELRQSLVDLDAFLKVNCAFCIAVILPVPT